MTPDDLDTLREGWDFEAKLAAGRDGQGSLPESIWETYSAMANTEGGIIVLGAKEFPDGSLQLHGIPDIDKVERDLWNLLENPQKVSTNVLRRGDVHRVERDGRTLLVIRVPKAPRAQRPVHLNGSWEKTYLRVHEGDRVASRDVARRMLADAEPDHDAQVLESYSEADFHGLKVPFALDANQFRNDESPAHTAVREALINTLIHADYEGRAGVRVLRDLSGFEFINPGLLLVALDQVWRGGVSESRNPVLQRLFGLLQLGEREGSGGPVIRQAWAQQHWSAPNLWEEVELSEPQAPPGKPPAARVGGRCADAVRRPVRRA